MEIMLMCILIPKTFIKLILSPNWAYSYLNEEMLRDESIRFCDFSKPIRYFILLGCVPAFYFLSTVLAAWNEHYALPEVLFVWLHIEAFQQMASLALIIGLYPLTAAFCSLPLESFEWSRSKIIKFYNIYAYQSATVVLMFIFLLILWGPYLYRNHRLSNTFASIGVLIAAVFYCLWTFYWNVKGLAKITKTSPLMSGFVFILGFVFWVFLASCLIGPFILMSLYLIK